MKNKLTLLKVLGFGLLLVMLILIISIIKYNNYATEKKERFIYHYSVLDALRNGVYTGDITVGTLRKKGDFGLGTYNHLDGEMLVLNGVTYRIASTGKVTEAEIDRLIPFASIAFFKADKEFKINNVTDLKMLQDELLKKIPSPNRPYAVRIDCSFESMVVGAANRLDDYETTGLAELMKTRPLYTKQKVRGTMVGFYTPQYAGSVDLTPFHFHFISEDRTYGGHLISGTIDKSSEIKISLDEKEGYKIVLPKENKSFDNPWSLVSKSKSVY